MSNTPDVMENTKGGLGAAQPYTRTPHGRALYKDPDTGKRKQNPDKLNPYLLDVISFPHLNAAFLTSILFWTWPPWYMKHKLNAAIVAKNIQIVVWNKPLALACDSWKATTFPSSFLQGILHFATFSYDFN